MAVLIEKRTDCFVVVNKTIELKVINIKTYEENSDQFKIINKEI